MTYSLRARCLAEIVGTYALVGLGTGSIVAGADAGGLPTWQLAVAWFAAVALPIQLFAFVSGAHLNPAVTIGLAAAGRFPTRETAPYAAAQLVGAFLGSFTVRQLLGPAAHLGATLPGPEGPFWILPLELTFTALLLASVLYLTFLDRVPSRTQLLWPALVVGLSTYLIGPWTGSSLNPARSIAPAVISGADAWLWLYLVATFSGALIAAALVAHLRPLGASDRASATAFPRRGPGEPPRSGGPPP